MLNGKRVLLTITVSILATILLPTVSHLQNGADSVANRVRISSESSPQLEVGRPAFIRAAAETLSEIRVVSYNIRWRGGDDLRRLIELFKLDAEIGNATILGLQEVDRNKRRTGNTNTVKQIAEELGMYYAWTSPPPVEPGREEETGVAILSPYPLYDVERIVLPHEGPGRRRRVAVGATVRISDTPIRFYSVHSETRLKIAKKIEQMKSVLTDLANYPPHMPAIVLGDLNTWEPKAVSRTIELFRSANFTTPFDNGKSTFKRKILLVGINLKLDWMWLRGLEATSHGIDYEIKLSDHWPLWAVLKLKTSKHEAGSAPAHSNNLR